MKYARLQNSKAVEIINVPEGLSLARMFHRDIVRTCVPCPEHVGEHWHYVDEKWIEPAPDSDHVLDNDFQWVLPEEKRKEREERHERNDARYRIKNAGDIIDLARTVEDLKPVLKDIVSLLGDQNEP